MKTDYIKNPRILLIGPIPPPPGGDSTWTLKYIKYYKKHGYEFKHVNTAIVGKRISDLSIRPHLSDEVKRCFGIWKETKKDLIEYEPNIVHFNSNCSVRGIYRDLVTVLLIKRYKKKMIFHCRCDVEYALQGSKIRKKLLKYMMDNASAVFVQNRFSKKFVQKNLKQNEEKIYFISNYIEKEKIIDAKPINRKLKKIIYTGHIISSKGTGEIIECAKQLPEIEFEMVGLITDEYSNYREIEDQVKNIKFVGNVDNEKINKYLDEADLFMLVSWSEGFSNSLVEAMARGLPCVVSDVGANREMIEDMGGIVCENKNTDQMVKAIKSCYGFEIRERQSKWNINKVRNCYSMDAVIDNIRDIYRKYVM